MASILDFFTGSATPEQNAGLLGFATQMLNASNGRQPVNFGQALAAGAQGFQQGRQQHADREQAQAQLQQLAAMRDLQMRAAQSDLQVQERAQGEQGAIQQAAQAALTPDGQFDQQKFLANVRAVNALKAFDYEKQFAKVGPKFDTKPQTAIGPDGKPFQYIIAENGEIKRLDGVLPRDKMELVNLGGKEVAVNPYALQDGQAFQRTMTPGEIASNQLGWANNAATLRGQNLNDARARESLAVQAAKEKAPTEFQGKSAAFGARAAEADKILTGLTGQYSPAKVNAKLSAQDLPLVGGISGTFANALLGETDQRAEQAQRDFVNAVLRQESGAAIGESEFTNARRQYFPQPGDSAAVIQQKARNRALAVQGLNNNAGRAAFTPATSPAAASGWSIKKVD
jgi:hypothetical protein